MKISRGPCLCLALACAAFVAIALAPAAASAQTFRGTILGTATDSQGGAIVGAKVTVRNTDTGLERTTETTGDGGYSVPELPIGNYTVSIEQSGFQTSVTTGVHVDIAVERRVDATLRPGQVTQRVTVSAETLPQIETTSDVLGGIFENKQVLDLPINGRDYTKMLIMVPGTAGEPNGGGDSPGSFGLFSANGNRGRANNFLLDGTDMNDGYRNLPAINQGGVFGTPGTVLPLESIGELRVLSNFEPEYGRNSGAVVNIVTKSGTNDLHGSAYEYFRNDHLNARNYFNTADQPKNPFRNNQFGGALGGPIVKDKTFFYLAYEGQREGLAITSLNIVPSLSDYSTAIGQIAGGDMSKCTPGSTIFGCVTNQPAGVIDPVILNFFNFCHNNGRCSGGKDIWPAVNIANASPGSFNSGDAATAFNNVNSSIMKIDHSFNAKNQVSGRYFFGDSTQSFPLGLAGGNNLPGTNTEAPIRTQLVSISLVTTVSSNKVNEARFGWNRYRNGFFAADRTVFGDPNKSLSLNNCVAPTIPQPMACVLNPRDFGLPTMRFQFLSFLGSSPFSNPRNRVDSNWQGIDNFSWKVNRHDFKFGYEFHRTAVDSFNDFSARGVLVFSGLTNFLQGMPNGTQIFSSRSVTNDTDRKARQNIHAFYAEDSWRWTDRLTVNYGLRWDYFGVIHEANGLFSVYDPTHAPFGLVNRDPLYNKDFKDFSPRFSIAWDPWGKGKTVIRSGFGLFYDDLSQDAFTGQIYATSVSNSGLAYNSGGAQPVLRFNPTGSALVPNQQVFATFAGSGSIDASTVDKNLKTPYVYNYNLNVQQELYHNVVLQVGYVGSAGRRLLRLRDINQPSAKQIFMADCPGGGTPGQPCAGGAIQDFGVPRQFTTPMSAVAPFGPFYLQQLESTATSNYNSLQASLNILNFRGLSSQLAYTWSHSIDTASDSQDYVPNAAQPTDSTNVRRDKGPSNFDVRQRFVMSGNYDIPKRESLGRSGEGWSMSGVLTLMSGHPFNLNYFGVDDYSGSGTAVDRPDVVGPIKYNQSNPTRFLDLSSFSVPCSFPQPPSPPGNSLAGSCIPGTRHFGSLGRNALLGPDYRNYDFAISKMTPITERFKLLFRADFYNLFNHPNFANPLAVSFFADAAPNRTALSPFGIDPVSGKSQGFSALTATSDVGLGNPVLGGGGQRSVQFAVKLLF